MKRDFNRDGQDGQDMKGIPFILDIPVKTSGFSVVFMSLHGFV
jgi:hypothetical protein